jgi:hypothetical protein
MALSIDSQVGQAHRRDQRGDQQQHIERNRCDRRLSWQEGSKSSESQAGSQ